MIIACEGTRDLRMLVHVVLRDVPARVAVRAVGPKSDLAFHLGSARVGGVPEAGIGIRDRDFDLPPPEQPRLVPVPGEPGVYAWPRCEVENYVLDPAILGAALDRIPGRRLPPYVDLLAEAGERLLPYEAARAALADVRNAFDRGYMATTWTGKGLPPRDERASPDACRRAARAYLAAMPWPAAREVASGLGFDERYDARLQELGAVRDPISRALVWFKGSDLLADLAAAFSALPSLATTTAVYETGFAALRVAGPASFPEFLELRRRVEAMTAR